MTSSDPRKPLGRKAYGSIGHLPGSRRGPGDHGVPEGQGDICTRKARDRHDEIFVQEKLDGSNVCVARIDGQILALVRAGYNAFSSRFEQHHLFALWVQEQQERFDFLAEGHRVCGEWLAQAHGTTYQLAHDPFVAFDIMIDDRRLPYDAVAALIGDRLPIPHLIHRGPPLPVAEALDLLGPLGRHGALEPIEGVVYRVQRQGEVDFLAKYVRPDKVDGCYLPEINGKEAVWNWRPRSNRV